MFARAPALEPGASQAQHDLRIAAKRLRYVLDIVAPCVGAEAEAIRDVAEDLQGVLGDLPWLDVDAAAGGRNRIPRGNPAVRREQHYDRFVELWQGSHTIFTGGSRLLYTMPPPW